ncbi:hypothetical protein L7F22_059390 [Adiantum nelumboides]|nr:hypothetical protein [Adiantum nelumboides]
MSDDGDMDVDNLGIDADELDVEPASSSSIAHARAEQKELMDMLDARAKARNMAVPTDDAKVRSRLRELGEPITCFGERRPDRRERLREVLVKIQQRRREAGEVDEDDEEVKSESEEEDDDEQEEEFFTEGTQELLRARTSMAVYSLKAAARRIASQKEQAKIPIAKIVATRKALFAPIREYTNLGSQVGDTRPVSLVRFSPNAKILATGSWSGGVRLWDIPSAREKMSLRGHNDKVGGLAWHPRATVSQSSAAVNLATGAADANVLLWSLDSDRPISTLSGHEARVARVAFHPSGDYLASASFDGTWRLWDIATATSLLRQEGHSKEVYTCEFQTDGALLASGGLDAIGRIWDCRTGRTAMVLDGHAREILALDWSPNGFNVVSASGDDTVRVWDLRNLKCQYIIPAHKSSVADVRFFRAHDERLAGLGNGHAAEVTKESEGTMELPKSGLYWPRRATTAWSRSGAQTTGSICARSAATREKS